MKSIFRVVSIVLVALFVTSNSAGATDVYGWFDSGQEKTLKLEAENVSLPEITYWNVPCHKMTIQRMNYSAWGQPQGLGIPGSDCARTASYGSFASTGNLLSLSGTNSFYQMLNKNGQVIQDSFTSVPRSSSAVWFSGGMEVYHNFVHHIEPVYSTSAASFGRLDRYKLNYPEGEDVRVKYSNGELLKNIKPRSFSFSQKQEKILLNTGSRQALVDVKTRRAIRFGTNSVESGHSSSDATTSLSRKGEVALVNDVRPRITALYDMTNCQPDQSASFDQCPVFSYGSFLTPLLTSNQRIVYARFKTDTALELFIEKTTEGRTQIDKYILSIGSPEAFGMDYLGMGESFASGEGVFDYIKDTDRQSLNMCHLGASSYPYLIGQELGLQAFDSVACSGALSKDVHRRDNQPSYRDDEPQSKMRDGAEHDEDIYQNFLPGYRRQIEFLERHKPRVVTLSIGGNDIGFGKKLETCVRPGTCFASPEAKGSILKEIQAQFDKLVTTYSTLRQTLPDSKIYIVGYPQFAKKDGSCALNVRFDQHELSLAEDIVDDLNQVIKFASRKAGVFYVDTSRAFYGSRLCEDESWKLAMHGVTAGRDQAVFKLRVVGKESYHPNTKGHRLYRDTILNKTNNFNQVMPEPDDSVDIHQMESKLVEKVDLSQIDFDALARPVLQDAIAQDLQKAGSPVRRTITVDEVSLRPGAQYRVEVHSDPQVIGAAFAEDLRTLRIDAVLPASLPPGLHTIRIIGEDVAGNPITLYKPITVTRSDEDFDGDGISNQADECNFIEPSGVDADKDEIDDGCDSFIAKPPENQEQSESSYGVLPAAAEVSDTQKSAPELQPSISFTANSWLGAAQAFLHAGFDNIASVPGSHQGSAATRKPDTNDGTVLGAASNTGEINPFKRARGKRIVTIALAAIPVLLIIYLIGRHALAKHRLK